MALLIKKLKRNELGINPDGTYGARGSAILIPKKFWDDNLIFNDQESNPNISILTLINNADSIYLKFTLHNTFTGKPNKRECRIYLPNSISRTIKDNDIITLESKDDESILNLNYYKPSDELYATFQEKLGDKDFKYFKKEEDTSNSKEINLIDLKESKDISKLENPFNSRKQTKVRTNQMQRDPRLQKILRIDAMKHYGKICAISKTVIKHNTDYCLEAAHIIPWSSNGADHIANCILLSKDLHWAFDKGLLTIDTDYKVKISDKVDNDSPIQKYNEVVITIPEEENAIPSTQALLWHFDNIFLK